MHTLIGLLVVAAAACAIARPPGPAPPLSELPQPSRDQPSDSYLGDFIIPRILSSRPYGYEDNVQPERGDHVWLNKEIDHLSQMENEEDPYEALEDNVLRWMAQISYVEKPYGRQMGPNALRRFVPQYPVEGIIHRPLSKPLIINDLAPSKPKEVEVLNPVEVQKNNETFAMTPLEEGYFENVENLVAEQSSGPHEGGESKFIEVSPPRETRQNPNLGRSKNLVANDVSILRAGLTQQAPEVTDKPGHIQVLESDPAEPIYSMAIIVVIGTALAMTIAGFAFGWYTIARKAKAAADVDYPAYGVTGPTIDTSGDRKLAHSAHMYHYQHQKQRIIAMERNGLDAHNGSVSDPESEEENEEGDYTVYECPGFATTGEMEVKNPLFAEDPTPATATAPGKCELVKPQPKE